MRSLWVTPLESVGILPSDAFHSLHQAQGRALRSGGAQPRTCHHLGMPRVQQTGEFLAHRGPSTGRPFAAAAAQEEFQGSHSGLLFTGHKGCALVTGIFHPGPSSSWFPRLLELVGQHQFLEQTSFVINSRGVEPRGCLSTPGPKQVFLRSFCGLIGGGAGERFSQGCPLTFHEI